MSDTFLLDFMMNNGGDGSDSPMGPQFHPGEAPAQTEVRVGSPDPVPSKLTPSEQKLVQDAAGPTTASKAAAAAASPAKAKAAGTKNKPVEQPVAEDEQPKQKKQKTDDPEETDSDAEMEDAEKKTKPKKKKPTNKSVFDEGKHGHAVVLIFEIMNFVQWLVQYVIGDDIATLKKSAKAEVGARVAAAKEKSPYRDEFERDTSLNAGKVFGALLKMFDKIEDAEDVHVQIHAMGVLLRSCITSAKSPLRSLIYAISNAIKARNVQDDATLTAFTNFCWLFGSTSDCATPIVTVLNLLGLYRRRVAAKADDKRKAEESFLKLATKYCVPGFLALQSMPARYTLLVDVQADKTCAFRMAKYRDIHSGADFKAAWDECEWARVTTLKNQLSCIGSLTQANMKVDDLNRWISETEADVINGKQPKDCRALLSMLTAPLLGSIVIAQHEALKDAKATLVKPAVASAAFGESTQLILRVGKTDPKTLVFHVGSIEERNQQDLPVTTYLYELKVSDKPLVCFNVQSDLHLAAIANSDTPCKYKDQPKVLRPHEDEIIDLSAASPPPPPARVLASPNRKTEAIIRSAQAEKKKAAEEKKQKEADEPKAANGKEEKAEPKPTKKKVIVEDEEMRPVETQAQAPAPQPVVEAPPKLTASPPKPRVVFVAAAAAAAVEKKDDEKFAIAILVSERWAEMVAVYKVTNRLMAAGTCAEIEAGGAEWAQQALPAAGPVIDILNPLPAGEPIKLPAFNPKTFSTTLELPPNTKRLIFLPRLCDPTARFATASLTSLGNNQPVACRLNGTFAEVGESIDRIIALHYEEASKPNISISRTIAMRANGTVFVLDFKEPVTSITCKSWGKSL